MTPRRSSSGLSHLSQPIEIIEARPLSRWLLVGSSVAFKLLKRLSSPVVIGPLSSTPIPPIAPYSAPARAVARALALSAGQLSRIAGEKIRYRPTSSTGSSPDTHSATMGLKSVQHPWQTNPFCRKCHQTRANRCQPHMAQCRKRLCQEGEEIEAERLGIRPWPLRRTRGER
jgi:hypothetical protein